MSFRELRNFCEQMRALGYPRIISIENFRKPNFELVADILFWLAQKYDPHVDISDNIDEEKHRVEFIKQICTLFISKARLRINPRKIYQSDGYAVQEILKISTFLFKAQTSPPADEDELHDFTLPSKLANVKAHKVLAQEITDIGAKLYDQLGKENDLKNAREKALHFLDSIQRNVDSKAEQTYINKCIDTILQQQDSNIQEMTKYVNNQDKDQKKLEENIRRRTRELEQAEKRLKGMTSVKPAFQEEYERLEIELERIYQLYVEKFRNLDYLEHQLDVWNQKESENIEQQEKRRKKIKKKIQDEELEILRGDKDIDESLLEAQMNGGKGDSRIQSSNKAKREDPRQMKGQPPPQAANKQKMQQGQNFYQGDDDEDEEEEDDQDQDIGELEGDEEEEEDDGDINDLDEDEDDGGDDDEF